MVQSRSRADLANVSAAMMWVLDQGDAEGALRMAVGARQVLALLCSTRPPSAWRGWKRRWICRGRRRVSSAFAPEHRRTWRSGATEVLEPTRLPPWDCWSRDLSSFEEIGDEAGAAICVLTHGAASLLAGDPDKGRREIAESLVRCQACGDVLGVAWCYDLLGIAAFVLGEYTEASSHLLESATQFESLDAPLGACHALVDLGLTLRHRRASCPLR